MGRTATGVRGMTLDEDGQRRSSRYDMHQKILKRKQLWLYRNKDMAKRSDIEDYRKTNRGGKGVKTMNITDNG